MIAAWLVLVLMIGTLIAGAASLLHSLQHAAGRQVRWVWAGAMALSLGLAIAAPFRAPRTPMQASAAALPAYTSNIAQRQVSLAERVKNAIAATRTVVTAPGAAVTRYASSLPTFVQRALIAACALSSLVTLLLMAIVVVRFSRRRRQWPRETVLGATVRVAPDAGPAVMGIAPAEIVLPTWMLQRTHEEQRLVLAHEQEHVAARDPLLLALACLPVIAMPWNPAMWYLWSRLRLAVELDCDRRVLRTGAAPAMYGQLLIDLSGRRSLLSAAVPAFSYSSSHLERRLIAMTSRPTSLLRSRQLAGMLVAAAAVLSACESKLPTSSEIDAMDVASSAKHAAAVGLDTANIKFVVDGKAVLREEAVKVAAGRIGSITLKLDSSATGSAKGGFMEIRTAEGQVIERRPAASKTAFEGLTVIDGVITERAAFDNLSADVIASVQIIKGAAATALYSDPRAAKGVIQVTTKKK